MSKAVFPERFLQEWQKACIMNKNKGGMEMATELEWKFSATEEAFSALEKDYEGKLVRIAMETTYYDTPDRSFASRRCTLRTRLENGKCICTLKTPAGKGRNEWEMEAERIDDVAPMLCKLAGLTPPDALIPVCGAKFTRLAATLPVDSATVELALDRGVLLGGGKALPLLEVEIEYKDGQEATAEAFAYSLASAYGLTPEKKSKFKRANELTL